MEILRIIMQYPQKESGKEKEMERLMMNEWSMSGEVVYINELDLRNEFAVAIKLKASSRRKDSVSSQPVEFLCLLEDDTYDEALAKGLDKFKYVTLSGHIETWMKNDDFKPKTRFVCDDIVEIR